MKPFFELRPTVLSSMLFVTNIFHLIYRKDVTFLMSWVSLFVSSTVYHATKDPDFLLIDQLNVYNVVYQGGVRVYRYGKMDVLMFFTIFCFLYCVAVYWYGYLTNTCVWHPDNTVSCKYHVAMHIMGSLGHHCIALMNSF